MPRAPQALKGRHKNAKGSWRLVERGLFGPFRAPDSRGHSNPRAALRSALGYPVVPLRGARTKALTRSDNDVTRRSRFSGHNKDAMVRDPTAVAAVCRRLQLPPPVAGLTRLFAESVTGLAVQLPGCRFPVKLTIQVAGATA